MPKDTAPKSSSPSLRGAHRRVEAEYADHVKWVARKVGECARSVRAFIYFKDRSGPTPLHLQDLLEQAKVSLEALERELIEIKQGRDLRTHESETTDVLPFGAG